MTSDLTTHALGATPPGGPASPGQRLLAIFQSAVDFAIVVTDLDGIVTDWNPGAEAIFGWTALEMIGQTAERFFVPEDQLIRQRNREMLTALAEGRGNDERWHVRKDGTRFWGSGEMMPLSSAGQTIGFLKILRDRTQEHEQAALHAAEASFMRSVLASSDDCIRVLALDATLEFMSEGGQRVMEVSDFNALRGQPWSELWSDGTAAAAQEAVSAARSGSVGRFQGPAHTAAGNLRYWDVVVTPILGTDNLPEKLLCICRDITAARAAEEAVREANARQRWSEERLHLALGAAGMVGIWDWDMRTDRVFADPHLARIYSVDPAWAAKGAPLAEFKRNFHPDDAPAFEAELQRLFDGKPEFSCEYRIRQSDGSWCWILAKGKLIRDDDGAPLRFPGTAVDVTEQKETELKILELNETLERRVEQRTYERDRSWKLSRDLQLVITEDGIIQSVNAAWTAVLDWTEEELVGRNYAGFVHPDDLAASEQAMDVARRAELPSVENRYRHRDGSYRWVAWVASPDAGLIYASGRHVTFEKEGQALLALAQEHLRQSQKMEAVGQLTGGLAHDFNNLLASISGSLELMQRRILQGKPEGLERYISVAQGSARRAASLTHRMLAFSRRQTLAPQSTDVNRLVGGMEELLRRTIGPEVTLEFVGEVGLWNVNIDPNQLENALLNLCINARDAMPGGGLLKIETANRLLEDGAAEGLLLQAGQYVTLTVTDTGTGMDDVVLKRIFEPFYTTKPIGMGTGLGLSMVYGFAVQSGGQVTAASTVDAGTTMVLYLPRHMGASQVEGMAEPGGGPGLRNGEGVVLVVDDEISVRSLVVEVLREMGFDTLEAGEGSAALAILRGKQGIDLLITDVGLPGGMNGRQVADAGRELRPGLKVLFITGYAEAAAVGSHRLESGMQVLTKPFSLDDLALRVGDLTATRAKGQ